MVREGRSLVRKEVVQMTLPRTREDLGYHWIPQTLDDVLDMLKRFLERNHAEAHFMDVYCSNDSVFRNILIVIPGNGVAPEEHISIQFNRESGRQVYLKLE